MHTIQRSQSTSVGSPTCSDQAVNLSVKDASTFLDAYRLGHLSVEVLVQAPPLHVQSGHSKVRHENPSCAVMGPRPEKGGKDTVVIGETEVSLVARNSG